MSRLRRPGFTTAAEIAEAKAREDRARVVDAKRKEHDDSVRVWIAILVVIIVITVIVAIGVICIKVSDANAKAAIPQNKRDIESSIQFLDGKSHPLTTKDEGFSQADYTDQVMLYSVDHSYDEIIIKFVVKSGTFNKIQTVTIYTDDVKVHLRTSTTSKQTITFGWLTKKQWDESRKDLPAPDVGSLLSAVDRSKFCTTYGNCNVGDYFANRLTSVTLTVTPDELLALSDK